MVVSVEKFTTVVLKEDKSYFDETVDWLNWSCGVDEQKRDLRNTEVVVQITKTSWFLYTEVTSSFLFR